MKRCDKRDEGSAVWRYVVSLIPGASWMLAGSPILGVFFGGLLVLFWLLAWPVAIPLHFIFWLTGIDVLRRHDTWELYDIRNQELVWCRELDGLTGFQRYPMKITHTGTLSARVHGLTCQFDGNHWRTPDAGLTARLQAATTDAIKQDNTIREVTELVFYHAGLAGAAEIIISKSDLDEMEIPETAFDINSLDPKPL